MAERDSLVCAFEIITSSFADRMIELLQDRACRERLSSQNVQIIQERASHEKHMARMETYYQELCERK